MDVTAIFALILKSVGIIETLIAAGEEVAPAIKVITDLVTGAQAGTVTDAQLAETEATLDGLIQDFNQPIS